MKNKTLILVAVAFLLIVAGLSGLLMSATGEVFHGFPASGDFEVEEGPAGERISRRVLVVVADGLGLHGLAFMPFVRQLGNRGAAFTARTDAISMSRVGYTGLSTGTKLEVSGVSSNSVKSPVKVGNVFRTARQAGLKTAFVGYSWWLDHFDDEIPLAAVDTGLKADDDRERSPLPADFRRRVLDGGRYVDLDTSDPEQTWRKYFFQREMLDAFGDDASTPIKEDELRARETARIIGEEKTDLTYLHLHSPDDEGHSTGSPYSVEYRTACAEADRAIHLAASALDLSRDTIIVTADHGFSDTIEGGGHGGWEDTSSLIPFVMAGAGVKIGTSGHVRQIDIQPTLSVLLGLPFSAHIQGRPVLNALDINGVTRQKIKQRHGQARDNFIKAYANKLGLDLGDAQEGQELRTAFARAKTGLRASHFLVRFIPALLLCLVVVLGLRRFATGSRPGAPSTSWTGGWIGPFAWISYEVLFYIVYTGVWGAYSFSSFAVANENLAFMAGLSLGLLAILWIVSTVYLKTEASPLAILGSVLLGVLLKAAFIFGFLGFGDPVFHPGGFVLFSGLSFYVQSATTAVIMITVLIVYRKQIGAA